MAVSFYCPLAHPHVGDEAVDVEERHHVEADVARRAPQRVRHVPAHRTSQVRHSYRRAAFSKGV